MLECMCAQTTPRFITLIQVWGKWSQNLCYLQGKNPLYQKLIGGSDPRCCIRQDSKTNTLPTELLGAVSRADPPFFRLFSMVHLYIPVVCPLFFRLFSMVHLYIPVVCPLFFRLFSMVHLYIPVVCPLFFRLFSMVHLYIPVVCPLFFRLFSMVHLHIPVGCPLFSMVHHCLVDLVARRPPQERKIPGSNPACAGIFFGVESYQ